MQLHALIMVLIATLLSTPSARIIKQLKVWKTTNRFNAYYGSYCDLSFDTQTLNFTYDCKGLNLSTFLVYDSNGFVVGSSTVYRGQDGYGTLSTLNGKPDHLNGYASTFDSTTNFIECELGYYREGFDTYTCLHVPDHASAWESEYGPNSGSVGFVCLTGYQKEGSTCVRTCSSSEVYDVNTGACAPIPRHSYKVSNTQWECLTGYVRWGDGSSCEKPPKSGTTATYRSKCRSRYAAGAPFNDAEIPCDAGWDYCLATDSVVTAVKIPANASSVFSDCTPSCDNGYTAQDGKCTK